MAKLQPSVMTLNYRLIGGDKENVRGYGWIDISQSASLVNRRFYRQGLNWAVAGITLQQNTTTAAPGALRVETLPTTWVTSNAWHKSFALWKKQQDEAMDDSNQESIKAKFNDFKIFMDSQHVEDYWDIFDLYDTNLQPRTAVDTFLPGEWQPSQIVIPNAVSDGSSEVLPQEYLLHMVGVNTYGTIKSRGMISGYENSRAYPQSPDPVGPDVADRDTNWMMAMFDVGSDDSEVLENVQNRNDDLPYDQVSYPGGPLNCPSLQLHSEHFITARSIGNRVDVRGFNAPCGLIKITNDTTNENDDYADLDIQVHLVPGNHRGYLAEPMQDM